MDGAVLYLGLEPFDALAERLELRLRDDLVGPLVAVRVAGARLSTPSSPVVGLGCGGGLAVPPVVSVLPSDGSAVAHCGSWVPPSGRVVL